MTASDEKSGARWCIRAETKACHEALDDLVSTLDLTTEVGLRLYLQGNLRAHHALAPLDAMFDGHITRRISKLKQDLTALSSPAPLPADTVGHPGAMAALGYRYVLAGSALGGRVLERRHAAAHSPRVRAAAAFIGDHALMDLWRTVLWELETIPAVSSDLEDVVAGAKACFQLFEGAFRAQMMLETLHAAE